MIPLEEIDSDTYETLPVENHKWGPRTKPEKYQMGYGVVIVQTCSKCGCSKHLWFTKKGSPPITQFHRGTRSWDLEEQGMPDCIDWEKEKLKTID